MRTARPKCPRCGSGEILLCSYQMGNVNEPLSSVMIGGDGKAADFRVEDAGGEMSDPHFECQGCGADLGLGEIEGSGT